jgi:mRNA interferase RelE/StbE
VSYRVYIIRSAEKDLNRLPINIFVRVSKRILSLESNPRPGNLKKLSGREEYRLRVGDYRVLYIINDKEQVITIVAVGHRREVYG